MHQSSRRLRHVVTGVAALALVSVGGVAPASAGSPPANFNDVHTSYQLTVNGSYTPIMGLFDCAVPGDGDLAILWYAPGPAQDHIWTDLDDGPGGTVVYSSSPITVNGTYQPFVGDFDGDGCEDIFWYAPGPAPDHVWYSTPAGFEAHTVTVNGTFTPLVGNWDGNDDADDVFWYGVNGGTESVWRGDATRGQFTPTAAAQVAGTGFRASSYGSGILFHQPGPGPDYFWSGPIGASGPDQSVQVRIDGTYEPYYSGLGILLYGPGTAPDRMIYDYSNSGELLVGNGTINGTYRVAVMSPRSAGGLILFHAPGPAPDYLWAPQYGGGAGISAAGDPLPGW